MTSNKLFTESRKGDGFLFCFNILQSVRCDGQRHTRPATRKNLVHSAIKRTTSD